MRLLADENVPRVAVDALAHEGFDIRWVHRENPGIADEQVLAQALREQRLLITFDKDFGELVFRRGHAASVGVVLFRVPDMMPAEVSEFVLQVLRAGHPLEGHFSVVERDRIRVRALP